MVLGNIIERINPNNIYTYVTVLYIPSMTVRIYNRIPGVEFLHILGGISNVFFFFLYVNRTDVDSVAFSVCHILNDVDKENIPQWCLTPIKKKKRNTKKS